MGVTVAEENRRNSFVMEATGGVKKTMTDNWKDEDTKEKKLPEEVCTPLMPSQEPGRVEIRLWKDTPRRSWTRNGFRGNGPHIGLLDPRRLPDEDAGAVDATRTLTQVEITSQPWISTAWSLDGGPNCGRVMEPT